MAEAGADKDDVPEEQSGSEEASDSQQSTSEWLMKLMKKSLHLGETEKPEQKLETVDLDGVVQYILSGKCKKIVTMAGAGISTSAGIPDFRSPGTGLYDNLQKYNLPNPQAIFDISFFRENPEPFFSLARELWPGTFKPTPCHYFLRLLSEKGLLLRHFTQNIDTLERVSELPEERIIEAHGTFHSSHCVTCKHAYTQDWIKAKIFAEEIPTCEEEGCGELVKPDIVFFGEQLPSNFFSSVQKDLPECDLLIIMGTSLAVQPFASLTSKVPVTTPRLYINLEQSASLSDPMMTLLGMGTSFIFDDDDNYRDVFFKSTCDDGCLKLADKLGWGDELRSLVAAEHKKIDLQMAETQKELQQSKEKAEAEKTGDSTQPDKADNSSLDKTSDKSEEQSSNL